MLVLADRGFTAHPLWAAAADSGADLLWRAKSNAVLPVLERLPDGSFRSELVASTDKSARADVREVRVIEYLLDDKGRPAAAGTTPTEANNVCTTNDRHVIRRRVVAQRLA
jgi:hypothetical protein